MDEKREKNKAKGVKKKNGAGEKPAGGIATILLKLDLHCEGCARKVKRSVRHIEGVEDVKADYSTGKLTVKGNVDPLWLRERVEIKTKKKVELLSAQPKKVGGSGGGGGGGDKKSGEKVEKKAEEKKVVDENPKKAQFNREVMKVRLHCDVGSALKVRRFMKGLTPYLKDKLNRNIDVIPPKKDDGSRGGDNKKEKEVTGGCSCGGGKKKDGELKVTSKSTVITEPKEEEAEVMNKMEYYGYSNPNTYYTIAPRYNQNYYNQDYGVTMHDHGYGHTGYVPPSYLTTPRDHGYGPTGYVPPPCDHGYGPTGYVPPPYSAPRFFSDENPNGCSVM
ncbi:hypothetical protein RND71_035917 [Anisodus tanguticus]|uniref:HMA domain-containing protein n=1 Tax=Anisodus tanguticus TaxID=243964 RepID=A0AAE1R6D6_9SOLA|nr:hypothetical protein RND71_035917 [Anisodus tanguticus]